MSQDITRLLLEWSAGDKTAVDKLLPIVYNELRRLAAGFFKQEHPDHTLQPTALVHEAYLRLVKQQQVQFQSRAQFFGLAAQVMRNILVSHARKRLAVKRGDKAEKISLEEIMPEYSNQRAVELVALDDALQELEKFDSRKSQIVQLRYFGGLSIEEIEAITNISPSTIRRDLRLAEAWLYQTLKTET